MVLASQHEMTESLCGPRADVVTLANDGFRTRLNQYHISFCDVVGGKTNFFIGMNLINKKHFMQYARPSECSQL